MFFQLLYTLIYFIVMDLSIKTSYRQMKVTTQTNTCQIPVSDFSEPLCRQYSLSEVKGHHLGVYTSLIVISTNKIKAQKTISFMSSFLSHGSFGLHSVFPHLLILLFLGLFSKWHTTPTLKAVCICMCVHRLGSAYERQHVSLFYNITHRWHCSLV